MSEFREQQPEETLSNNRLQATVGHVRRYWTAALGVAHRA